MMIVNGDFSHTHTHTALPFPPSFKETSLLNVIILVYYYRGEEEDPRFLMMVVQQTNNFVECAAVDDVVVVSIPCSQFYPRLMNQPGMKIMMMKLISRVFQRKKIKCYILIRVFSRKEKP